MGAANYFYPLGDQKRKMDQLGFGKLIIEKLFLENK